MNDQPQNSGLFTTTRWTMIVRAGDSVNSMKALDELCQIYWFPLYVYVRSRGYGKEDAEDITQGFFSSFLGKCHFPSLKPEHGKFRSFLLASIKNYISNEYARNKAVKRGGDTLTLSLDWENANKRFEFLDETAKSPEELYDRQWALSLLERVLGNLREEWSTRPKSASFEMLEPFLTLNREEMPYHEASQKLGMSEGALRVTIHRIRKRYRELLKNEISQTLSDPSKAQEELQVLLEAFS